MNFLFGPLSLESCNFVLCQSNLNNINKVILEDMGYATLIVINVAYLCQPKKKNYHVIGFKLLKYLVAIFKI